jgi:hypothetical protein
LDTDEDSRKSVVSHFFQSTQETGFEEDFGVTKSEFVLVNIDGAQKFLGGFLVIKELTFWDGIWVQDSVSLFEVSVLEPVWITFSADSNTFEDTITSQLVDGQVWVHFTWAFVFVWNDASDKVWRSGFQVGHKSTEGFSVEGGYGLHSTTLLLLFLATGGLSFLFSFNLFFWGQPVGPDFTHEHKGRFFQELDNGVVQWILVLFQPVGDVVTDATGVVVKFEVDVSLTFGFGRSFTEVLVFAHVSQVKFFFVSFIGGFWEHTLFFEGGQDTHWLFNKFDTSGKIHTEIDGFPVDAFFFVFFLFKNEHMVVEELLEFFVGEVDAQLFEGVETENFETGNIETTDEEGSWEFGGKSNVTLNSNEVKQFFEDTFGQGVSGVVTLFWGLTFRDVFRTDLDSWGAQVFGHIGGVDTEQVGGFVGSFSTVKFTLFFSLFLFEDHALEVKDSSRNLVDTIDNFVGEVQNFEGFLGGIQFITIVQVWNGNFTHTDVWISVWILHDQASFNKFWFSARQNLVEDVVVSFTF